MRQITIRCHPPSAGRRQRRRISGSADSLILTTLLANTARDVGGVGAVPKIIPPRDQQSGIQGGRPLLVGPRKPPQLIGAQAQVRSAARNG